jgi:hypothetical protein
VRTVVEETLNQRITVREGDRTRSVTKLDGVILTLVSGAAKGNPRAQASLITLLRSLGMTGETPEATHQEPLTANDDAIITDFLRRRGAELPRSEMEEHDSASTSTSTPLSERKS